MRIFIVDDHPSFCEGLIAAIRTIQPVYEIDFVSDSEFVPAQLVGKNQYDLIVTDLLMPGWGGFELINYLNRNRIETPIVVMSSVRDEQTIQEAFDLGIVGYIPKSYSTQQIVDAIESCRAGEVHVPQFFAGRKNPRQVAVDKEQLSESQIKLTKRQAEILSLMEEGLSNQAIADRLFIGLSTVKTHISQLFKLFGVKSRLACIKAAKQLSTLR